jgi:hypothetical protein
MVVGYFNGNIGAHFIDNDGHLTHFCIEEHDVDNLETLSGEDFKLYLNELVTYFKLRMESIKDRVEGYNIIKRLNLEGIDVRVFVTEPLENVLKRHIGNLAIISIYAKEFFKELINYANSVEYPWFIVDPGRDPGEGEDMFEKYKRVDDISYIFDLGREARNGVSMFEKYTELANNLLLPLFPVEQYSYKG